MPWTRTLRRCAALAAAAGLVQPLAHAADPQPYDVKLIPTGDSAIDGALKDSSSLDGLRESAPVGAFALVTRAEGDVDRLQTALHSFGYYDAKTKIDIDGHAVDDPALPDLLAAMPAGSTAHITITTDRGALFHVRHVVVAGDVPAEAQAKLGLKPGDPAIASTVIAGQSNLLDALRASGHALAKVSAPDVLETPADKVLDVTYKVDAGPRVDIGTITVDGLKDTNDSYVRRRLTVHSGEQYSPATIDAARQDLSAAGIFSSVDASTPDHLAPDGTIPLKFVVTERDRHSVAFNLAYATDTGATGGVTFTYRNVFGNAETLKLNAAITQAESDAEVQAPGYNFTATFIQPDFGHRDQTFTNTIGYVKENLYAYSRKAALASSTLSRKLSTNWSVSVGLSGVQERVLQEGVDRAYTLLGAPLGVTFDSTGPEGLFNPTHGIKAAATITPTAPLAGNGSFYTLIQVSGSTYINLAPTEGRSVLALRGLVGSAQGAGTFAIPPDQRFYAGGSATVRGYRYQSVGPLFADQRPQGGASVTAATVEFRQRFGESYGAVAFIDAGQVGNSSAPFTGTVMEGAGIGARYYTSLGPIRLDVAAPLKKRRKDEIGEVYIGLGQAF